MWERNTEGDTFIWYQSNSDINIIEKDEIDIAIMQYRVYRFKEIDTTIVEEFLTAVVNWLSGLFNQFFSGILYLVGLIYDLLPPELKEIVSAIWSGILLIGSLLWFVLNFSILGVELYIYLVVFEFINTLLYVIDRMMEGDIYAIHLLAQFFERQINLVMSVFRTIHAIVKTIFPI